MGTHLFRYCAVSSHPCTVAIIVSIQTLFFLANPNCKKFSSETPSLLASVYRLYDHLMPCVPVQDALARSLFKCAQAALPSYRHVCSPELSYSGFILLQSAFIVETAMSFVGLLYPDNDNRANRAEELSTDCENLTYDLQTAKDEIDVLLEDANAAIKKAYTGVVADDQIAVSKVDLATVDEVGNWVSLANVVITPIVTGALANKAFTKVFTAHLLKNGRIGEAAFKSLVGLPKWMKFGTRVGGFVVGAAATVGVDLIISGVTGSVQRDELQDAIKEAVGPRLDLKQNAMVAEEIKKSLSVVISSFSAVAGVVTDQATLDTILNNILAKNEVDTSAITEDAARKELQDMDTARGSWTNEDGSW